MITSESRRRRWMAVVAAVLAAGGLAASACGFSIGRSVEQREIIVERFGAGPRPVLLIGGLHTGAEDNTRVAVAQIAAYVAGHPEIVPPSVSLYVVASANPDGTALGIHTNARGVDLNRNWPADNWRADACHPASGCRSRLGGEAPLSEPETRALYRFIESLRPEVTVVWHSQAALVEANEAPPADAYARAFGAGAGYPYLEEWTAYEITGQLIDALEQRLGLPAFDVELTYCCEVSAAEIELNIAGLRAMLDEVDRRAGHRSSPTPKPSRTAGPTPTRTPYPVPGR